MRYIIIYDTIIAAIQIIMLGFILWFTIRLKNKSAATWWFVGFCGGMALVGIGFVLEVSILLWGHLFLPIQLFGGVCALACLIQFAYHIAGHPRGYEAGRVGIGSVGVVGLVGLAAFVHMRHFLSSPVPGPYPPFCLAILYLAVPCCLLITVGLLFRQVFLLIQTTSVDPVGRPWAALRHILDASTSQDAVIVRAFVGVVILGFIPAAGPILTTFHIVSAAVVAYVAGLGLLLVLLAMFLAYFDYAHAPLSFTTRISGISLTFLLALFGFIALLTSGGHDRQFQQKRFWQFAMVQQAVLRHDLDNLPAEVAYIGAVATRPGAPATSDSYRQVYPRDEPFAGGMDFILQEDSLRRQFPGLDHPGVRTLDYLRELTNLPTQASILRYANRTAGTIPQYAAYRFEQNGNRYEVGFRLDHDLQAISHENLKLIALLFGSSLILWLTFPYFFRFSLVRPLSALLHGVQQANFGNLNITIPVSSADEIGALTHEFNCMIATIKSATTRLEQRVAERTNDLECANSRLRQEIAERERFETALQKSEEKYRNVAERANDGIVIAQDGLLKYCNTRLAEMLDYAVKQIEGTPFAQYIAPDSLALVYQYMEKRLQGLPAASRYEIDIIRRDGSQLAVEIQASLMEYAGQPAILAFVCDITERKLADVALRQSEAKYRLLAENMYDVVWTMDLQGRFTYVSPSVYTLRGYTPDEVLQQTMADALTPMSLQVVLNMLAQDNHTNRFRVGRVELEQPRKDGSTVWTECVTVPLYDQEDTFCGWVGVSRDITERRRVEEELRQARDVAEMANQAKSTFLANMSHELRTPLNAIIGFAQIMLRSSQLSPEQRNQATIIFRSGEHLLALINNVLDLSKIEAGQMMLTETSFDLYGMLEELKDMFDVQVQSKGLHFLVAYTPDVPRFVLADEIKLRQVLINLIANAVKFTQAGRISLRICVDPGYSLPMAGYGDAHVDPVLDADWFALRFAVEDTGIGISHDEQDRIFESFAQTHMGGQIQGGTGLGLAISRRFVQMMGGDMQVCSDVGQGATFLFTIPVKSAEAYTFPVSNEAYMVIGLAPDQPCYRLLIVDDRPESRSLLVQLLAPLGFAVREAGNGQEALQIWSEWDPHLIWMDMRMPVMDGYAATRTIKATTKGQQTIVVALTASAFESERSTVLASGCDDFMRKPVRADDIFRALQRHLGVRYLYATHMSSEDIHTDAALSGHLALDHLAPEQLDELEQAAVRADMHSINQVITQITQHDADLALALKILADNFDYDQILQRIERCKERLT